MVYRYRLWAKQEEGSSCRPRGRFVRGQMSGAALQIAKVAYSRS